MFHVKQNERRSVLRYIGHNTARAHSVALLTCAALLLGSCGVIGQGDDSIGSNSVPEDASKTPPVTYDEMTAEEWLSTVRDADYGGYEFTIMTSLAGRFVTVENTENEVEKTINKRNTLVENKYDIKITEKAVRESEMINAMVQSAHAGLQYADLVSASMQTLSKLAANGTLTNLYSLPYYDSTAEFCNAQLHNGTTAGHTCYAVFDDLTEAQDYAWCVFFNKSKTDAEAMYQMSKSSAWTWDAFLANAANGGFASYDTKNSLITIAFATSGVEPITGGYGKILSQNENTEELDNIAAAVKALVNSRNYDTRRDDDAKKAFKNGEIAFLLAPLHVVDELKDMTNDFGVLPLPSYDGSTRSVLDGDARGIAVPSDQADSDRTGLLLTALTAASYQHIAEAKIQNHIYFDLRDNDSALSIRKIYDTQYINPGILYSGGYSAVAASSQDAIIEAVTKDTTFEKIFSREKTQLETIANKYFR